MQIAVTSVDLLNFLTFLSETLHVPRGCVHFPYQTLCVNGDGEFETIEYLPKGMTIDDFAEELWKRKTAFPRVRVDAGDREKQRVEFVESRTQPK